MADAANNTYLTRAGQMFLRLDDDEIAWLVRFGEPRSFPAGEMVACVGQAGGGSEHRLVAKLSPPYSHHHSTCGNRGALFFKCSPRVARDD